MSAYGLSAKSLLPTPVAGMPRGHRAGVPRRGKTLPAAPCRTRSAGCSAGLVVPGTVHRATLLVPGL